jgi:hypothetical protein
MKFVKRLWFVLAISALIIAIAVPASAGGKNKACGKIRPVSGKWTFDTMPGENELTAQEGYWIDDTEVYGDYVAYFTYTGQIEGVHMLMYSTYVYPDPNKPLELVAVVRLHGKAFGKDIDVWGKQTLELTPNEDWSEFEITGSGKYMFPFKDCSPCVFLHYYGTYWPNYQGVEGKEYSTGDYKGFIIGTCK